MTSKELIEILSKIDNKHVMIRVGEDGIATTLKVTERKWDIIIEPLVELEFKKKK